MIESIPYTTDDTDLAAYLCSLGAPMPVLDRSEPRIAYIFELAEQQIDAIPHFKQYNAIGNIHAYADAKKKLLRMIKNG